MKDLPKTPQLIYQTASPLQTGVKLLPLMGNQEQKRNTIKLKHSVTPTKREQCCQIQVKRFHVVTQLRDLIRIETAQILNLGLMKVSFQNMTQINYLMIPLYSTKISYASMRIFLRRWYLGKQLKLDIQKIDDKEDIVKKIDEIAHKFPFYYVKLKQKQLDQLKQDKQKEIEEEKQSLPKRLRTQFQQARKQFDIKGVNNPRKTSELRDYKSKKVQFGLGSSSFIEEIEQESQDNKKEDNTPSNKNLSNQPTPQSSHINFSTHLNYQNTLNTIKKEELIIMETINEEVNQNKEELTEKNKSSSKDQARNSFNINEEDSIMNKDIHSNLLSTSEFNMNGETFQPIESIAIPQTAKKVSDLNKNNNNNDFDIEIKKLLDKRKSNHLRIKDYSRQSNLWTRQVSPMALLKHRPQTNNILMRDYIQEYQRSVSVAKQSQNSTSKKESLFFTSTRDKNKSNLSIKIDNSATTSQIYIKNKIQKPNYSSYAVSPQNLSQIKQMGEVKKPSFIRQKTPYSTHDTTFYQNYTKSNTADSRKDQRTKRNHTPLQSFWRDYETLVIMEDFNRLKNQLMGFRQKRQSCA
ncbi:UNKNOWN [Stylonychia lemnae]|uniref:Uncharacterized protein n=1 Tax=Stylonychia lemnae TaxID=5949 RepID=A0A078AVP7_STYLE|nr:UNKNOWN [Stylonychia lemnae]|eukprot:CDW86151.1 UNKNOWN [Stylonychia lemnae]